MALTDPDRVVRKFNPDEIRTPMPGPRYNVAPGQDVAAMIAHDGKRVLGALKWGLVPSWAKEASIGNRMINARAETVAEKPSFRTAFKKRRCLIPADAFYEWKKTDDDKVPYAIRLADNEPFAFAGLYEIWRDGDTKLATCTILTTRPNELMKPIHHRMPVILEPEDWNQWTDPQVEDAAALQALLRPFDAARMTAFQISTHVNAPANDDPRCIEAA